MSLSAWRLTAASLGLLIFAALVGRSSGRLCGRDLAKVSVAGLFLALHFGTWIASLEYLSIARSTLLVATSPLWAGLAGLAIPRLRPARSFWLGLPLAMIGTWIVTQSHGPARASGSELKGDLLALAGAACIVPYLVLSQDVQKGAGTRRTITWTYTAASVCLWLFALATGSVSAPVSSQAWISILGMALFAQLLGHGSLNWSLKHFSAVQVATATLLEPVFASVLAWALMAEAISWMQALGGLVLLAGMAIVLRTQSKAADSEW